MTRALKATQAKTAAAVMQDSEMKWRAESDLRTLMDCEEIRADPKRLKAALAVAEEKQKALAEVKEYSDASAKEEKTEGKAERANEKKA